MAGAKAMKSLLDQPNGCLLTFHRSADDGGLDAVLGGNIGSQCSSPGRRGFGDMVDGY